MTRLEQQWAMFQENAMRKAYDAGYRGLLYFWTYKAPDEDRFQFKCTSAPPVDGQYIIRDMSKIRND